MVVRYGWNGARVYKVLSAATSGATSGATPCGDASFLQRGQKLLGGFGAKACEYAHVQEAALLPGPSPYYAEHVELYARPRTLSSAARPSPSRQYP